MDTGSTVAIIGALGVGGILAKLVEGLFAWIKGKTAKEHDAWAQRDAAWKTVAEERARADREATARRRLEEALNIQRIEMRMHGITPDDWPTYKTQP